ncbi:MULTISPECIES: DUF305 domain-containing protein [Blautia]|uniref:DUF305 domain-containing protein n=1 Tax=Blautia TaxID=572511 RepID=UPI000BA35956|nr:MULTISPECIES: DUF305 domain-containing protein [Blautia]
MKLCKLIPISLATLILMTGCGSGKSNTEDYLKEENAIMDKMMDEMDRAQNTGSAELDFLNGMIPHHQSAVDMSKSYLEYAGKDGEFKGLAENIISAQNTEIDQMNTMIERFQKVENPDTEKEAAYLEDYRTMMDNHHSSHTGAETSDLETAFAQGMSMHHQMAVDMAEIILKYTDDEELTAFADNIITQQKKEIEEMQSYLDDNTDNGSHKH